MAAGKGGSNKASPVVKSPDTPNKAAPLSKGISATNLEVKVPTKKQKQQKKLLNPTDFLFSHLSQYEKNKEETLESKAQSGKIHPAIHALGLQYHSFKISGGNARCLALLSVFQKVRLLFAL